MLAAKVTDVFQQDCHLIVRAEHYHPDGTFWFLENYRWQGREGLKRKRVTNTAGRLLMDNGKVAPLRIEDGDSTPVAYLPKGREWARRSTPHMDEDSILDTIRSIHRQRLTSGWPQGTVDLVSRISPDKIRQQDRDGCPQLINKFAYLVGREITI